MDHKKSWHTDSAAITTSKIYPQKNDLEMWAIVNYIYGRTPHTTHMKIKSTLTTDCDLTTNLVIQGMERIAKSLRQIKRTHKILKRWKKALDDGKITKEKFDDVMAKAQIIFIDDFEIAFESGMAIQQTDEMGWDDRAKFHSQDIVDDITNN